MDETITIVDAIGGDREMACDVLFRLPYIADLGLKSIARVQRPNTAVKEVFR